MPVKKKRPPVGQIVSIPLLGGGFAFGYITVSCRDGWRYLDIFDHVGPSKTPPEDIHARPLALRDVVIIEELSLPRYPKRSDEGNRWELTALSMGTSVRPLNRYVRMGLPPRWVRRIDLLEEQPDLPLAEKQVNDYPQLEKRGSPYPVAMVEVAVKRLSQTPMELIKEWRQGQKMVQPQPEAPKETKPRKSATMHVRIELGHDGFPSDEELLVRHRLEDLVLRNRIGKIVDAGAGGGVMDLLVRLSKADGRERFQKLVSEEGLSAFKVAIE